MKFLCTLAGVAAALPAHPRLWFGADDLPQLQARMTVAPYDGMIARLRADLWLDRWANAPANSTADWDMLDVARRHSFLGVLEGNATACGVAQNIVQAILDGSIGSPGQWANVSTFGLTLYNQGSRVAAIYDFCASLWPPAFTATVGRALVAQADIITTNGGTQQNTDAASNWQGSRGASAIMCYLATDEPYSSANLATSVSRLQTYLQANYANGSGWNLESMGYLLYPSPNFVIPAGLALFRNTSGSIDVRTAARGAPLLSLAALQTAQLLLGGALAHPDFADDNANWAPEGLAGLSFAWAPASLLPGVKYMYDRAVGPLNAFGNVTYDHQSSGTIWSFLYYNASVQATDPADLPEWTSTLLADGFGGNGKWNWRSAYNMDAASTDIETAFYAKLRGAQGHNAPDGLGIRLTGLNNSWIIGGGRYGLNCPNSVDCYKLCQSTLYGADPDGPASALSFNNNAGVILQYPTMDATCSGSVVAWSAVNNAGVANHTRRLLVDYAHPSQAAANIVLVDTHANATFWQINTLAANTVSIDAAPGPDGSIGWTITAPYGGQHLRAVLLSPPAAAVRISTGVRPRSQPYLVLDGLYSGNQYVKIQLPAVAPGDSPTAMVVALSLLSSGQPAPPAAAAGQWAGPCPVGNVTIGALTVSVNCDSIYAV